MRELTRSEIIQKHKEIEHFLKTDPDIPTRRYLASKGAELYVALEQIEEGIAAWPLKHLILSRRAMRPFTVAAMLQ